MTEARDSFDLECSIISDTVHEQEGGTCYAHAIATVLASAERSIEGRIPKDHDTIVSEITKKYGSNGGNSVQVLTDECKKRQLRFEKLKTTEEAKYWIKKNHALLADFVLYEHQWTNLDQFLKREPHKIMTYQHLCQPEPYSNNTVRKAHAVVIGGYDEKENCWIIKNSWGKESGYHGYWRVSVNNGLLLNYYRVYFEIEDLKDVDIFNSLMKYGFYEEIRTELCKREKIKEFEIKYRDMMYQRMLNKVSFIFKEKSEKSHAINFVLKSFRSKD